MTRLFLCALLTINLSICCYVCGAKVVDSGLYISFIARDSTGLERTSFTTGDRIYFECRIVNNTEEGINYKAMEYHSRNREPRIGDLFSVVCLANDGSRQVEEENSPPPNTKWIEKTLAPGDSLAQVNIYHPPTNKLQAGEYKAWFTLCHQFSASVKSDSGENGSYPIFEVLELEP